MKLRRHLSLFAQAGIFLLGFSGSLYASLVPANSLSNWYSIDDAFYYYKVAQNVLAGHSFTFDGLNLTNGFHPLWMLVCLGVFWLSRFNLLLPLRVLALVSGALNGLAGVLLYRLLRKVLHPAAAVVGACTWMLLPAIFNITTVHGMEAAVSAPFLVLFLSRAISLLQADLEPAQRRKGLLLAGLWAALAILARLDNLFVVFAVGMFMLLRVRRIRRGLVFDLTAILAAAVTAWLVRFGSVGNVNGFSLYPMLIIGLVLKPVVLYFAGLYSPAPQRTTGRLLITLAVCACVIFTFEYGLLTGLHVLGFNFLISRAVILLDVAFSIVLIAGLHLLFPGKPAGNLESPVRLFQGWLKTTLARVLVEGLVFSSPIALLVGAYMLANKLTFGILSPVSGQVKLWWGTLERTVYTHNYTMAEVLGFSPTAGYGPWSLLTSMIADVSIFMRNLFAARSNDLPPRLFLALCIVVFILLAYLLSRRNGYLARKSFSLLIPALILGCFLQISYYTVRGYAHTRAWYWVAEMLTLVLLGSVLTSRLFEKLKQWTRTELTNQIICFLFVGFLLFLHSRFLLNTLPPRVTPENEAAYLQPVRKLEESTPEGALIGMTGGGNIAYFIENRTIVNLDGLINSPEYFTALKNGTGAQFLDQLKLDFVYSKPYILLETQPYDAIFTGRLAEVGELRTLDKFTLYQYLR